MHSKRGVEMNEVEQVFGVVYEPDGSGSEGTHSHEIFLVTWDGRVLHTHGFSGITSFDVGHRHGYAGVTEPAPSGIPHTHAYSTETTFNDGHRHFLSGRTGPAIPLPGGGHYHVFAGVTTVNGRIPHRHSYSGRTGNEMPV
ncbi:YmaF family protein [Alicyclobacillus macrosporangiidus]|uniref:YmaF family protein n=1 Tax=Alicyclobacillus macrosporangiidus TaxID=392015 RepID=UPI0031844E9F